MILSVDVHQGTIYSDRYLAWAPNATQLDPLLCEVCRVPSAAVNYRRTKYIGKPGAVHITIVSPPEVTDHAARLHLDHDPHTAAKQLRDLFQSWDAGNDSVIIFDLTNAPQRIEVTDYVDERKKKTMRSYTLPIGWSTVTTFRKKMGLPPANLHMTLGLEEIG